MEPRFSASKQINVPPREYRRSTVKPRSSRSCAMISARTCPSTSGLQPTTIARARASTGTARRKHRTMTRDLYIGRPSSFQLGAKESPYEVVRRGVDDFLTRTVLNDAAALEHYQSLGQFDGLAQVVRYENHGARLGGLQ